MPMRDFAGTQLEVDEDGFIQDPQTWTESVAAVLAGDEEVESLSDAHWKVVKYIREYYLKFGIAPMIRKLCRDTETDLGTIYQLFPSGPAKGACKIAGLPKPTGCV